MSDIFYIIAAMAFLYYFLDVMLFIVTHWAWFAGILGTILVLGSIFYPGSLLSGSSKSSSDKSLEGDYTVYDLGKPDVSVDRFHVRKD